MTEIEKMYTKKEIARVFRLGEKAHNTADGFIFILIQNAKSTIVFNSIFFSELKGKADDMETVVDLVYKNQPIKNQ